MKSKETNEKERLFRETTERFWFLQLIIEVQKDGIYVRLEPFQRSFRQIRLDDIQNVTVTTYDATTYAGWHWGVSRTLRGNTVYRLQGGRGVEIQLENGNRWFIGSQQPADLAAAIERTESTTG